MPEMEKSRNREMLKIIVDEKTNDAMQFEIKPHRQQNASKYLIILLLLTIVLVALLRYYQNPKEGGNVSVQDPFGSNSTTVIPTTLKTTEMTTSTTTVMPTSTSTEMTTTTPRKTLFANCTSDNDNCSAEQVCVIFDNLRHSRCECPIGTFYDNENSHCQSENSDDGFLLSYSSGEKLFKQVSAKPTTEKPKLLSMKFDDNPSNYTILKSMVDCTNQNIYFLGWENSYYGQYSGSKKVYKTNYGDNGFRNLKSVDHLFDGPIDTFSIDWVAGNIYWLQPRNESKLESKTWTLKVTNLKNKKTISFPGILTFPVTITMEICVHPGLGLMFTVDRNKDIIHSYNIRDGSSCGFYKISRSDERIHYKRIHSLTIDFMLDQLCWLTSWLIDGPEIKCVDIKSREVVNIIVFPQGSIVKNFVVYNNYFYWMEQTDEGQYTYRYNNRNKQKTQLTHSEDGDYDNLIFIRNICPANVTNPCGHNNGGCEKSQICLINCMLEVECR